MLKNSENISCRQEWNMLIENIIKREDRIPLFSFSGTAYECGRQYAKSSLLNYPDYSYYLQLAWDEWRNPPEKVAKLFAEKAPFILDIYRGICDVLEEDGFNSTKQDKAVEDCTSFSVCQNELSICGQTKDTSVESLKYYTVLRMRLSDGPTILVLAYPGEVLGYGLWSNGNSLFRNDLKSSKGNGKGLSMVQYGLLALASNGVEEMIKIAQDHGIKGAGNLLLSDNYGKSVSVEFNAGGVSFVYPEDGILTHANHAVGDNTRLYAQYPDKVEEENSIYREEKLYGLLKKCAKNINISKAFACLADHSAYPRGICRHIIGDDETKCTTTVIVAETHKKCLSVTKGPACLNDYVTYSM